MRLVFILQPLVLMLCSSECPGATLDACMMVLLSDEFRSTSCSSLGRNHTRPCLVQSDQDEKFLKMTKVIGKKFPTPRNKICAARTKRGEADCVSVHLKNNLQPTWQWTEWAGTSPTISRRFVIVEGNTNTICPYTERYFIPETYRDCLNAYDNGMHTSGVYTIQPHDGDITLQVYCEQELDGGGWTVFQRRQDGSWDFLRNWADYKAGFGELSGEHWLGNDYIHLLTKNHDQRVKFRLQSQDGAWASADYDDFWIADESDNYRLYIAGYSGAVPPGDSMLERQNGQMFTTKDRDNDIRSGNCAALYKGAWWYARCHLSNLNGIYGSTVTAEGVNWYTWKGHNQSMKYTAIMLRRK